MNKKPAFLFLFFFLAAFQMNAQQPGNITINKDPRVDLLVNKQIEINEITTRNARRYAPGFRIQVISSNNRNKAVDAKTKVYREFPELKAYMMYQSPFFRLRVGNFKERPEAEAYLKDIQKIFPGDIYIVPDTIEINSEAETNNE